MKQLNKISKEKAQRILFIAVLVLVFGVFLVSLSLLKPVDTPPIENPPNDPPNEQPEDEYEIVTAPYTNTEVEILRKFWSVDKDTEDQEKSIIVFEDSYYMSKGVSYVNQNQEFDVVASLSGTVEKITESPIYGKVVLLDHGDGIKTEYLSLGAINVAEGDQVVQGAVIGTSGSNQYDIAAENHLHYRIQVDGKYCDPEILIGKAVNEIK